MHEVHAKDMRLRHQAPPPATHNSRKRLTPGSVRDANLADGSAGQPNVQVRKPLSKWTEGPGAVEA